MYIDTIERVSWEGVNLSIQECFNNNTALKIKSLRQAAGKKDFRCTNHIKNNLTATKKKANKHKKK